MILDKILEHKRQEVKEKKNARYLADLKARIRDAPAPIGFYQALTGPSHKTSTPQAESPRLIAEVKKASPRRGTAWENFDPPKIAQTHHKHGATARAVHTAKEFFQRTLDYPRAHRDAVPLPDL